MPIHTLITPAILCLAASLLPLQAVAATTTKAPATKAAAKPANKAVVKPKAKPPAKPSAAARVEAPSAAGSLSDSQLAMAARVLTGTADCEFRQTVTVEPHANRPGTFRVKYDSTVYTMVPEDTTTGAVRLIDAQAGVVWLQIPHKSMMMNTRVGRRMVDACTQPAQRQAKAEADAARLDANAAATMSPTLLQTVQANPPAAGAASSADASSAAAAASAPLANPAAYAAPAAAAAPVPSAVSPATPASGIPVNSSPGTDPAVQPAPR